VAKLLLIEDEPLLLCLLHGILSADGHDVMVAATGRAGVEIALSNSFDLILLDLMLPDLRGDEVLATVLDQRPAAKFMVLSSVAEVGRRVAVLSRGAVDFVAKPFANAELLARVRARLRDAVPAAPAPRYLIAGGLRIDIVRRQLVIDDRRIDLSHREFALLTYLLQRPGKVCTREELLDNVWGIDFDPGTNIVDVYVRRLRSKVAADRIETVRNVGYRLAAG
jgi:DNA-binding response OmpR family regulator